MERHRSKLELFLATVTFGLILLLGQAGPVQACNPNCCWDTSCSCCNPAVCENNLASGLLPAGETQVTFLSPHRALIEVQAYSTMEMESESECAVAFPEIDGIERIERVTMVDAATGAPLAGYREWVPNDLAGNDFAQLASQAGLTPARPKRWQGFVTTISPGLTSGIRHSFLLEVTLKRGVTLNRLISALRSEGVMANGSANFDGSLDLHHYYLRRLGDGDIHFTLPGHEQREDREREARREQ